MANDETLAALQEAVTCTLRDCDLPVKQRIRVATLIRAHIETLRRADALTELAHVDADEIGESVARHINSLRTRIVALQEKNDVLRMSYDAVMQRSKTPF